jgi:ABC-type sugar transport system ATPase subunit
VFLLDEPLSNLDARLRIRMRRDLKALHQQIGSTIVYVTHDQSEAMTLSSRIAVFDHGKLQQYASPAEIYDRPANTFVANFVGDRETNFLDGTLANDGEDFVTQLGAVPLGDRARIKANGKLRLGARPEAIAVEADPRSPLRVTLMELAGADLFLTVRASDGVEIVARSDPRVTRLQQGDGVRLVFDPSRISLFDAATGLAVSHGA